MDNNGQLGLFDQVDTLGAQKCSICVFVYSSFTRRGEYIESFPVSDYPAFLSEYNKLVETEYYPKCYKSTKRARANITIPSDRKDHDTADLIQKLKQGVCPGKGQQILNDIKAIAEGRPAERPAERPVDATSAERRSICVYVYFRFMGQSNTYIRAFLVSDYSAFLSEYDKLVKTKGYPDCKEQTMNRASIIIPSDQKNSDLKSQGFRYLSDYVKKLKHGTCSGKEQKIINNIKAIAERYLAERRVRGQKSAEKDIVKPAPEPAKPVAQKPVAPEPAKSAEPPKPVDVADDKRRYIKVYVRVAGRSKYIKALPVSDYPAFLSEYDKLVETKGYPKCHKENTKTPRADITIPSDRNDHDPADLVKKLKNGTYKGKGQQILNDIKAITERYPVKKRAKKEGCSIRVLISFRSDKKHAHVKVFLVSDYSAFIDKYYRLAVNNGYPRCNKQKHGGKKEGWRDEANITIPSDQKYCDRADLIQKLNQGTYTGKEQQIFNDIKAIAEGRPVEQSARTPVDATVPQRLSVYVYVYFPSNKKAAYVRAFLVSDYYAFLGEYNRLVETGDYPRCREKADGICANINIPSDQEYRDRKNLVKKLKQGTYEGKEQQMINVIRAIAERYPAKGRAARQNPRGVNKRRGRPGPAAPAPLPKTAEEKKPTKPTASAAPVPSPKTAEPPRPQKPAEPPAPADAADNKIYSIYVTIFFRSDDRSAHFKAFPISDDSAFLNEYKTLVETKGYPKCRAQKGKLQGRAYINIPSDQRYQDRADLIEKLKQGAYQGPEQQILNDIKAIAERYSADFTPRRRRSAPELSRPSKPAGVANAKMRSVHVLVYFRSDDELKYIAAFQVSDYPAFLNEYDKLVKDKDYPMSHEKKEKSWNGQADIIIQSDQEGPDYDDLVQKLRQGVCPGPEQQIFNDIKAIAGQYPAERSVKMPILLKTVKKERVPIKMPGKVIFHMHAKIRQLYPSPVYQKAVAEGVIPLIADSICEDFGMDDPEDLLPIIRRLTSENLDYFFRFYNIIGK
jgi:hypothetical protein